MIANKPKSKPQRPLARWQALTPRRRIYWAAIALSAGLGAVMGALIGHGEAVQPGDVQDFIGNSPLPARIAAIATALWLVANIVGLAMYHRAVDDHEERAWLWAGLAGWYAFIIPTPAWWLLARGGLARPVDMAAIFFVSLFVNMAVWLWLKYR